jgi:putative ABC transport system permease protein
MRKALGAYRAHLSWQFFIESFLMTLVALGLALILAALFMPAFNSLTTKNLDLSLLSSPLAWLILVGIGLLVSLVAGSYPALYLSSFRPTSVLKGTFKARGTASFIRKGLVVFQFAVSVFLIVGTMVIYRQLSFLQDSKLGFDKEQVVVLSMGDRELRRNYQTVKSEVIRHPNVLSAAVASDIPGYVKGGYMASAEGMPEGERYSVVGLAVDEDVVETLGLTLKEGRGISTPTTPDQETYQFLLTETTVRRMGLDEAEVVGKQFNLHGRVGEVAGVVEDFHFFSLRESIEPLVMFTSPGDFDYMMVKIAPTDVTGTLAFLEEQWKRLAPHRPFEYTFLDAELDALYRAERRVGKVFTGFAVLAVLIACLGLFGLAALTAEQRTKEIGVRKVLGASEGLIVYLLSKDFIKLVLVAFVLGMPLAYYAMDRWLQNFAYRVDLGVGTFALAGLLALAVAALTVSYQAIRTALLNPVDTLRYE